MNVDTVIKYFKDGIITEAVCDFYCGGDSMGGTDWNIQGTFPDEETAEIEDVLDTMMYDHVDFYVNSDGHYQGESGTVTVEYDDFDEDDEGIGSLKFDKSAEAEYYEVESCEVNVTFTDEEKNFIEENIDEIDGEDVYYDIRTHYKRDLILTPKLFDIREGIVSKIKTAITNFYHTLDEDADTSQGFELLNNEAKFNGNTLTFEVNYGITVYRSE